MTGIRYEAARKKTDKTKRATALKKRIPVMLFTHLFHKVGQLVFNGFRPYFISLGARMQGVAHNIKGNDSLRVQKLRSDVQIIHTFSIMQP